MADLKKLITEGVNPDTVTIDECSTEELLRMINREDQKVAPAVEKEIPQITKAVDLLYPALKSGGRMFYVGAGTSGRLGVLDASECPPTYGTDPQMVQGYIAGGDVALRSAVEGCEDDPEAGRELIRQCGVNDRDVVIGITASGSAAFVIAALQQARELGAATIGVTNNQENDFAGYCDVCIAPVCGPEVISGSTRMKAGTAQKLVLNMLTTSVMVKLGKVYHNRMVDLRASNKKLNRRSVRMICEITGVPEETAAAYLEKADKSAKLAIMCILSGLEPDQARTLLEENQGYLKSALKSIGKE